MKYLELKQTIILFFAFTVLFSEKPVTTNRSTNNLANDTGQFNINRIACDLENNGMIVSHRITGHSGLEWPKDNNTYAVYASGLWLAGKVDGDIRTAAAEYASERAPGPYGSLPEDQRNKLYEINRSNFEYGDGFLNWPVTQGAPWIDENGNGIYEPAPEGPDHPEFIGDQVIWYVSNDREPAYHNLYKTEALGVEIQTTVFGYNRTNEVGDMMFVKELIINKAGHTIDSMYIGIWSDPDLGDAGDDFVGCDTVLGMGICYNDGIDYDYEDYVDGTPAVGYDFFQGPMVPSIGDTAQSFGQKHLDMKNLKMTSFLKYIGTTDPTWSDPNDAQEVYNFMKGIKKNGDSYINTETGESTKFNYPDDPNDNAGEGDGIWVDGDDHVSGDRRFVMSSGPFTMAPGDSQEVIYGIMIAADGDPLDSYTKLKEIDLIAQTIYDTNFKINPAPQPPSLQGTPYAEKIILNWDDIAEQFEKFDYINLDTNGNASTYRFEGYNLYQLDGPSWFYEKKQVATFDIINEVKTIWDNVYDPNWNAVVYVPVQYGEDSGLQRTYEVTEDAFTDFWLYVNREYYFGISAYTYNPFGAPKITEVYSDVISIRTKDHDWEPNDSINYYLDFEADHILGNSDGQVYINFTDPKVLTGDSYSVTFNDYIIITGDTSLIVNWRLTNTTKGSILVWNNTLFDDKKYYEETYSTPVTEGFQLIVKSPKDDLKSIGIVANSGGTLASPVDGLAYWRFPSYLVAGGDYTGQQLTTEAIWLFNVGPQYGVDEEAMMTSVFAYTGGQGHSPSGIEALVPDDFEIRFTGNGSAINYWGNGEIINVPFEWWNIGDANDPADDFQLVAYIQDEDNNGQWNLQFGREEADHGTSGGFNDPWTDLIYVLSPVNENPGSVGHDAFIAAAEAGGTLPEWYAGPGDNDVGGPLDAWQTFARTVFMLWNGGDCVKATSPADYSAETPEVGTIFRIATTKPITSNDVFTFSTISYLGSTLTYTTDYINVWPNPYFGHNPEEEVYGGRRVLFINLPETGNCTIRIFDIAGYMVRRIEHNNTGLNIAYWDLHNNYGRPVANGIFIVEVETEIGNRILKLAIRQ